MNYECKKNVDEVFAKPTKDCSDSIFGELFVPLRKDIAKIKVMLTILVVGIRGSNTKSPKTYAKRF